MDRRGSRRICFHSSPRGGKLQVEARARRYRRPRFHPHLSGRVGWLLLDRRSLAEAAAAVSQRHDEHMQPGGRPPAEPSSGSSGIAPARWAFWKHRCVSICMAEARRNGDSARRTMTLPPVKSFGRAVLPRNARRVDDLRRDRPDRVYAAAHRDRLVDEGP